MSISSSFQNSTWLQAALQTTGTGRWAHVYSHCRKQCMEDKPVTSSVSSGSTVYRQGEHSVLSGGTRIRLEPHVPLWDSKSLKLPWSLGKMWAYVPTRALPASTFLEPHHLEQSSSPLSEMPSKQSFTPNPYSKWLLTWTGERWLFISSCFFTPFSLL